MIAGGQTLGAAQKRSSGRDEVRVGERPLAMIKGAGDLGTGVALRLVRSGFDVVMTELSQPRVERRAVAFAEAVYDGSTTVEGIQARLVSEPDAAREVLGQGRVAVLVDPEATARLALRPMALVDAILAKRNTGTRIDDAPAVVGLGPGFVAGQDVHAVVETLRGHTLGRVITSGQAQQDTGVPEELLGLSEERVLRAPRPGVFVGVREIGDSVQAGDVVGHVEGSALRAPTSGVLRGIVRSGLSVKSGEKLGDVDPRGVREYCFLASDRALAVAGGALEAICTVLGGVWFAQTSMFWQTDAAGAVYQEETMHGSTVKGGSQ